MDEQTGGPYLHFAVFCENVIEDKQGVLSLIRIIDRTVLTAAGPDAPEKMPPFPFSATIALGFKSGFAKGSWQVRIRPTNPDGQPLPEVSLPMQLEGDDRGQNIVLPVQLTLEQEGLYWFDVFVADALVTRMPFRVVYQRVSIRR
ncbi:MAG: hypothetical protein A3F92_12875 [Candidatus Rokubacteria bacterium RIFCSPLOWO2_12_FULL_71_22]|nr:MAG: hypothetical protein A3I17_03065 [Candidatus Rokubacteria bacterium RIFCSPLOWO2_02_FULL_72_37]OGL19812.1 MAG: hypothetical protein A3F92_12875 [Candidatus Rokubacteria bacterium RIFCSPLOWO2_12_FULL_71_22]